TDTSLREAAPRLTSTMLGTNRSVQVPYAQSGGATIPLQTPGDGVSRRF
ncbi:hypothetical protein IQ246_25220, partial [aff. Roholtiella sp. LEGE 12411]|nr:hypothetical protein [aff. Roholtiella sp. LEGE 12411]